MSTGPTNGIDIFSRAGSTNLRRPAASHRVRAAVPIGHGQLLRGRQPGRGHVPRDQQRNDEIGLASLTDGKPAFLNFSRTALVNDFAFVMPPREVVIEILETVEPDDQVLAACDRLKAAGYRVALDDFSAQPGYDRLVAIADLIKVDILATPSGMWAGMVQRSRRTGVTSWRRRWKPATCSPTRPARATGSCRATSSVVPSIMASKTVPGSA